MTGAFRLDKAVFWNDLRRYYLEWALKQYNGNRAQTARALGITTRKIFRLIQGYEEKGFNMPPTSHWRTKRCEDCGDKLDRDAVLVERDICFDCYGLKESGE